MDTFRKKRITIELSGEQWFAVLARIGLGNAGLSEEGRALFVQARDIMQAVVLKAAEGQAGDTANRVHAATVVIGGKQ